MPRSVATRQRRLVGVIAATVMAVTLLSAAASEPTQVIADSRGERVVLPGTTEIPDGVYEPVDDA